MSDAVVVVAIVVGVICAILSSVIAQKKNLNEKGYILLGLLLGPLGVLITALMPQATPPPPEGMSSVVCPRCNAAQNVDKAEPTFECWQCKTTSRVLDAGGGVIR
ncbi:hypothetical protein ACFTZB_01045 [Rhodococcus sp. NPDC057014]|uniref:hypothetical protein n=1 Tax=Rhodococcus sp. NPDC057014 TaxID=3346000 RepID=UPI003638816A